MTHYELMSYTVHDLESWSDGKVDAGIPEMKRAGICAGCRKEFWIEDAKLPRDFEPHAGEELETVKDVYDLDWIFDDDREVKAIIYYYNLLKDGFADTDEREYYLRSHLLWSVNDLVRYRPAWWRARNFGMLTRMLNSRRKGKRKFEVFDLIHTENLERLIFLLIKSGDVDLLYLAELYREAGNLDKAAEILEKVEEKGKTWRMIRKKIRKKDRIAFKLRSA
jgi:hypothetical protein